MPRPYAYGTLIGRNAGWSLEIVIGGTVRGESVCKKYDGNGSDVKKSNFCFQSAVQEDE